jgi:hypothetical protein
MNRLRMLLIAAALMTGGSALASAQSYDHNGRGYSDQDRNHDRGGNRDRYFDRNRDRRFDRDEYRTYFDRDNRYFDRDRGRNDRRLVHRDDHRYFSGERR